MNRFTTTLAGGALALGGTLSTRALTPLQDAAPGASAFARTTIDVGVVVSDLEASVTFYRDALGFQEAPSFSVGADFCRAAGLTDSHPLEVRVMVLGEGESATKLKLMSVAAARPAAAKNDFIHSQLGLSYLTIYLEDLTAGLEVAKQHGVLPVAKGPVPLDPSAPDGMNLALLQDPDGNWVELLGPM